MEKKTKIEVTLSEEDIKEAIKQYVERHYELKVESMDFRTGVRGNYDKGTTIEYVRMCSCECSHKSVL